MARLHFTPHLRRFTDTPVVDTAAATLREALEAAFGVNARLRGYVLDDQGHLRPNVVVFIEALWQRPERAEWFGGGYDAPGIHSICAHPARPGEALVAVSCGGAWLTQDAGAHWSVRTRGMAAAYMPPDQAENPAIQDPHRIVRCKAAPDVLWCQHHNGIWRSIDNAASWQEIDAPVSSFGFAAAAHPQDRDTAWFVPAMADERRVPRDGALVVNRTRGGGRSFETLRRGLPQSDCHDLVYRHGLAAGAPAAHLRGALRIARASLRGAAALWRTAQPAWEGSARGGARPVVARQLSAV